MMNRVINFHEVSSKEWFESVIKFVSAKYRMVPVSSLDGYYAGNQELENTCHITVDDGHSSFYKNIYPILVKYNVPATLFVSPVISSYGLNFWFQEIERYDVKKLRNILAGMYKMPLNSLEKYNIYNLFKCLSFDQIRSMIWQYQMEKDVYPAATVNMTVDEIETVRNSGLVEIGGHTNNHPILMNEDDRSSQQEIAGSVNMLGEMLGTPIRYFSFPNGIPGLDFTSRELRTLADAGIRLCFTTETKNFTRRNSRLAVPRFGISDNESLAMIKAKLLLGDSWTRISRIRSKNELRERMELKSTLPVPGVREAFAH